MNIYPSKETILKKPVVFRQGTLDLLNKWKEEYYLQRKWQSSDKLDALQVLLRRLGDAYEKPLSIQMEPDAVSRYQPEDALVVLDSLQPSILTALHEFAHHLYGASEVRACRWSVWLFKICFPNAYEKLVWKDHMLVRQ